MTDTKTLEDFQDLKILSDSLPELTNKFKEDLKDYVIDIWTQSIQARQNCNGYNLSEKIKEVEKADNLEHQPFIKNLPKWQSRVYLGWVKQAHISTTAYLIANILSGDFFALTGRTEEDKENADKMTKVIKYLFDTDFNFRKTLYQAISQFVKKGNTVIRGFWQVIQTYLSDYEEVYEEAINESTGETIQLFSGYKRVKKETNIYDDVAIEYVDFDDFQFYPITGDYKLATKVHRTQKTYAELMQLKDRYINLDEIEYYQNSYKDNDINTKKIELKTAHIVNAYIDDIQISNAIVTIADDKYVIEYRPMPIDYGLNQFLFAPFEAIEGTNLGKGLCFDALPLQYMANLFINMLLDAQKIGTFSSLIIPDDEDDKKFVARPNAIIKYSRQNFEKGMLPQPLHIDLSNLPFNFESIQTLKGEFEAMTVPEFIKGVRPERQETATRDTLVAQGGENRLGIAAENFNELLLKPLIQLVYTLYRQRAQLDDTVRLKIARIACPCTKTVQLPVIDETGHETGETEEIEVNKSDKELLEDLSEIIPMDRVDVAIDGFKTNINKQKMLQNIQVLCQMLPMASDDIKEKINQEGILDTALLTLDLDNDDFIFSDEEAKENTMKNIQQAAELEIFKMQTQSMVENAAVQLQARKQAEQAQIIQQEAIQKGINPDMLMLMMQQQQQQAQPPQQQEGVQNG